jgi:hypothetical protein
VTGIATYLSTVWILLALILLACLILMGKEYRRTVLWASVSITLSILAGALVAWYLLD